MGHSNLERMIGLAEKFFSAKNDPNQIAVTEEVMTRLRQIHAATLTEQDDGSGPVAWVMVIPTTRELMEQFIAKEISEKDLLEKTPLHAKYDVIYLCSALVLPEHRGKGLAKRLLCKAIKCIQADCLINCLFCWPFSPEGRNLAASVARDVELPLLER